MFTLFWYCCPPHLVLNADFQAVISLVHIWSRVLSVKKILRTMPKPYMPTKHLDVTKVSWVT
jgi:hypothetical protein